MQNFHQKKFVPYPPELLFHLVMEVEDYPSFLPWCQASRIVSRTENEIIADLVIRFKVIIQQYQSQITYTKSDEDEYKIKVIAISGPFRYLNNEWRFSKKDDGTLVDFFIDFEFKSILLDKLMGVFFNQAMGKIVEAFEERASLLSKNKLTML